MGNYMGIICKTKHKLPLMNHELDHELIYALKKIQTLWLLKRIREIRVIRG